MLIIGHLAFGYIASYGLTKLLHISSSSSYFWIFIIAGIIASIIPDLDAWLLFCRYKSLKLQRNDSHRKYFTHIPLLWIIFSLLAYITIQNAELKHIGLFILAGSMSHFAGDSVEYGIMWLWPFSKKQYFLHEIEKENFNKNEPLSSYYWKFFTQIYARNWTFYIELIFIIAALWVYF